MKKFLSLILVIAVILSSIAGIRIKNALAAEKKPDLLITEIMPFSQSSDDPYEFIELYNNSESSIDLKNYKFFDLDVDIAESKTIPAKGIMVLCMRSTTTLEDFNKFYGTSLTADKYMSLPNAVNKLNDSSESSIILTTDEGFVVSAAYYKTDDFALKKSITYKYPEKGFSMVRLGQKQEPTPGVTFSSQVPENGTKVTGITLDRNYINLKKGESTVLIATVTPSTAINKTVIWTSSNSNSVVVDSFGRVMAKENGVFIITATTLEGGFSAKCMVIVSDVFVTGVTLDRKEALLKVGEALALKATVLPQTAANNEVTWTSSNINVAAVDRGIVYAKAQGTAVITVRTIYGGYTDTCKVTVSSNVNIPVTGISLDKTNIKLEIGKAVTINARIIPLNATNKNVIWSSSNPKIAYVDTKGVVVGISKGTAIITARTEDKGYTAASIVNVVEKNSYEVPVTGIKLNKTAMVMKIGEDERLTAIISPLHATNKNVSWKSEDTTIASVDNSGLVKALKQGLTKITATTEDGKYSASCSVYVEYRKGIDPVKIKINKHVLILKIKQRYTLKAIITPKVGRSKDVIWKSMNPDVATIDKNGRVTPIKAGTTTITVSTKDGRITDECVVIVYDSKMEKEFKKFKKDKYFKFFFD